jgi:Zn-dependent peptidase ImmA (M78 family)
MTNQRKELARKALAAALSVRTQNEYSLIDPVSVFDLAIRLGIELRFQSLPSLEGMYSPTPIPAIVIGTERPGARQVYSCAHEIGHHVFSHGTKVDHYVKDSITTEEFDEEEFLAQSFAGFLLAPKIAIQNQIRLRSLSLDHISPSELYRIANYFGMGFQTLVSHLRNSLGLLTYSEYERLQKSKVSEIRCAILGRDITAPLVCVDEFWQRMPVDLEVGDVLFATSGAIVEGNPLVSNTTSSGTTLFHAIAQGQGRIVNKSTGWAAFVRVRPKKYTGRAIFRHLEAND